MATKTVIICHTCRHRRARAARGLKFTAGTKNNPLIVLPCRVALDFIYCSPLNECFLTEQQPLRDLTSSGSIRTSTYRGN